MYIFCLKLPKKVTLGNFLATPERNDIIMQILSSDIFKNESQIILVNVTNNTNDKTTCLPSCLAKVYMCEKVNNKWITIMETDGFIGKNGLGKEREGDLKTPIGLYDIGIAFGTENNITTKLDYYKLDENMYWVCDPNSKYYNQIVDCSKFKKYDEKNLEQINGKGEINLKKDWDDSKTEHLIEEDIAYKYALEIKYNKEAIPAKGSAIFLHCIKNGPTAGCVSINKDSMKFVLENINRDAKIYIYQ